MLNVRVGPWRKAANHRLLNDTARGLRTAMPSTHEMFRRFYAEIARDYRMQMDPSLGEEAHMQRVWEVMMERLSRAKVDSEVRPGRWFHTEQRGLGFLEHGPGPTALLMLLLLLGFRRKW